MKLNLKLTAILSVIVASVATAAVFIAGTPAFEVGGIEDGTGDTILSLPAGAGTIVNNVVIKNSATGAPPVVTVTGSDSNPSIALRGRGTGNVLLQGSDAENILVAEDSASAKNYLAINNAASGSGPRLRSDSAFDANVDLLFETRGTGRGTLNGDDILTETMVHSWTDIGVGEYSIGIARADITITRVQIFDTSGSYDFNIYYASSRNDSGTSLWSSDKTCNNADPLSFTSFDSDSPSDGDAVWLEITGSSGGASDFQTVVVIEYQLD